MRPSPHVWTQIEKRIGGAPATRSHTQAPQQKRAPWRALAAGVALFAVLIGGLVTWRALQGPELQELATLTAERATQPAWHLHADGELRHLRAVAGAGAVAQAGKSYELWALPDNGAAPVSLGLMPVSGVLERDLTDAQRAALRGASKVAVSLEPEGGSTTGGPTGPVLFVAERIKRA